jgi:hypothetical protein
MIIIFIVWCAVLSHRKERLSVGGFLLLFLYFEEKRCTIIASACMCLSLDNLNKQYVVYKSTYSISHFMNRADFLWAVNVPPDSQHDHMVRCSVTLKWLPVVMCLIQSQRIVRLQQNTVRIQHNYKCVVFIPTHTKSLIQNVYSAILSLVTIWSVWCSWEYWSTVVYACSLIFKRLLFII